jgi:hypothetical protein
MSTVLTVGEVFQGLGTDQLVTRDIKWKIGPGTDVVPFERFHAFSVGFTKARGIPKCVRATVHGTCPFCKKEIEASARVLPAHGMRCQCGALALHHGRAYQRSNLVKGRKRGGKKKTASRPQR